MRLPAALVAVLGVAAACAPAGTPPPGQPSPAASLAIASVGPSPSPPATPALRPTPLPDLEVRCDVDGNRPELTCEQLTTLALGAVAGLPHPAAAVGLSAYGFPCGTPIPQAPAAEPCTQDVDEGPVGWVAFDGTATIAALRFEADGDGVHTTVAATGQTPMSIGMLLEAANPVPSFSPLPSQPAYPGDPVLRLASGKRVEPALHGGCASVFYGDEGVAADQCGPSTVGTALGVPATRVGRGDPLVLVAPEGWRFGTNPALAMRWYVRLVRSSQVAGLEETEAMGGDGLGRTLDSGIARHATLTVEAPTTPGDYLVQFDGGLTTGAWSFIEGTWYWHILVR